MCLAARAWRRRCILLDASSIAPAAQTMILEACSQVPPTVALMRPLQRVAQPAGHLLAAFHSIIAIRDTSLYLMISAAVSWASTVCFMLLLVGQGRHIFALFLSESWLTGSLPALCTPSPCQTTEYCRIGAGVQRHASPLQHLTHACHTQRASPWHCTCRC